MGDVTYQRHERKIEHENSAEFAETVFRGLRFEIRGSKTKSGTTSLKSG